MKFTWICDECDNVRDEGPGNQPPELVRKAMEILVAREGEPDRAWHVADEWHLEWQNESRMLWAEIDVHGDVAWMSGPAPNYGSSLLVGVSGIYKHWRGSPLGDDIHA